MAASMQGLVLGGLLQGVSVEGVRFSGSVLDVFRRLPLLTAVTVVVGYSVLGATWLRLKSNAVIGQFARGALRIATPAFVILVGLGCIYAADIQPGVRLACGLHLAELAGITSLFVLCAAALFLSPLRGASVLPFFLALSLFLLGMGGFSIVLFPNIIPFRMSLWDAASSSASQRFLLIGATLVTPVILAYSAFAYWVFRGKTPENGWGQ
jgi:cytochrome d ubiquinol oxidase subunit II